MSGIDLALFCAPAGPYRRDTTTPFSRADYSYATDGRVMVRVPRRSDVPARPNAPAAERIWPEEWPSRFVRLTPVELPPAQMERCEECEGRRTMHVCPSCPCICYPCNGAGTVEALVRVAIGSVHYQAALYRKLLTLPDLEIEPEPAANTALRFRFDGGEGLLMPLRNTDEAPDIILHVADGTPT